MVHSVLAAQDDINYMERMAMSSLGSLFCVFFVCFFPYPQLSSLNFSFFAALSVIPQDGATAFSNRKVVISVKE